MALIKCPECGKEISDKAKTCINCGYPISENISYESHNQEKESWEKESDKLATNKSLDNRMDESYQYEQTQAQPIRRYAPATNTTNNVNNIKCIYCGSTNVVVSYIQVGADTSGKAEVRKKSIVTRAGNATGRATMIAMTGGLWALTPKKSKYLERQKSHTQVKTKKICICQSCGKDFELRQMEIKAPKEEMSMGNKLSIAFLIFLFTFYIMAKACGT